MADMEMNVPDGWKATELGKLLVERKKSGLKVSDAANFGQYPFFTSGEAVLQHTSKQVEGDNIYLATGGVANIKYFSGEAAYSTDTYTVSTSQEVETEYLYFNLLNILYYINANYFQGSGLKHLQKKDFKKHFILYPEQPAEQRRIARILSKVDEAISQTEQLIAKYSRLKTGLMQDLLTKGIDEHGNIRSEETHAFKDSPLGRIPAEWEVVETGELFEMTLGKMLNKQAKHGKDVFPYLGNKSVQWGRFDLSELQEMSFNEVEKGKFSLRKGDLLVCEGGEAGRCAIWQEDNAPIYFQKALHRLRVNSPKIIVRYMHEYMISAVQKSFFNDFVSQTSIKHFTQEKFQKLPVLLPPVDEQRKICKISKSQDVQLEKETQNLAKLQSLKTGLMQDLLSGKVRVGQLIRETADA